MTTTKKVVLRKKAPFFCRTTIQGKHSCLKPLAETDGDFCATCAEAKKLALDKLARGPIWPI